MQSKWFTVLAAVAIGFFLFLIVKLQPSLKTVVREMENLEQKIAETEKSRLEEEKLKEYSNSPDFLERQARLKLNYKKPGESVFFVYKNPYAQDPVETNVPTGPSKVLPNWQKWLNYLLNR